MLGGISAPQAGHFSLSSSSDPSAQAHSDLGPQGRTAGGRAAVSHPCMATTHINQKPEVRRLLRDSSNIGMFVSFQGNSDISKELAPRENKARDTR